MANTIKIREDERESRTTTTRTRGNTRTNSRTNRTRDVEETDEPEPRQEEANKYDPDTQSELDLWLGANVTEYNNTLSFAERINEHVREEFRPIRQIASEENASKTAAAIDGILLARQERITELEDQLETAKAREDDSEDSRNSRRGRTDQITDTESGGRRRR